MLYRVIVARSFNILLNNPLTHGQILRLEAEYLLAAVSQYTIGPLLSHDKETSSDGCLFWTVPALLKSSPIHLLDFSITEYCVHK